MQSGVDLPTHLTDGLQQLLHPLGRKILCLYGNENAVRSCQGVDGQHSQRRHTVDENVIIVSSNGFQILFQDGFPAQGVYQRYLHAGKGDVGGQQVNALRMRKDSVRWLKRLVQQYLFEQVCQSDFQLVRLGISQADGQGSLGIAVHQQHLFPAVRQPDAQVRGRCGFAHSAFLVYDGKGLMRHRSTSK